MYKIGMYNLFIINMYSIYKNIFKAIFAIFAIFAYFAYFMYFVWNNSIIYHTVNLPQWIMSQVNIGHGGWDGWSI